jgi:crotonobetaine/carnitine-CoA ligase
MKRRYQGELTFSAIVEDRAERFGDDVFASDPTGVLTFAQLRDRAGRVAGWLQEQRIEPGDRVATMLDASLTYLGVWFGCAWAGVVEVPVNTDYKGTFLSYVLQQSGARVLVIGERWLPRLEGLELPELEHVVVVDAAADGVAAEFPIHPVTEVLAHEPVPPCSRLPTDLVYILYTSGTTGPSKGVMHSSQSAINSNALPWLTILELSSDDVAYSFFPLFHGTGRNAVTTTTLLLGGRVEMRSRFSLRSFWDEVRACGATWFPYMGTVIQLLYAAEPSPDDLDNPVRRAFGGGVRVELMEAFERRFGLRMFEGYGSTELGQSTLSSVARRSPQTMGPALPHLQLEVHDEHDRLTAPGEPGEIVARPTGPDSIFKGYWRLPEATLEATRNLWFHSGDRGVMSEDGHLLFLDRIKDTIRRRGENISSFEVEAAMGQHPGILECAAYAVEVDGEEEVALAVVARPGQPAGGRELFEFAIERLPRFAVPRYVRFVDAMPKTPSQRVQKHLLRQDGVVADMVDRDALGIVIAHS